MSGRFSDSYKRWNRATMISRNLQQLKPLEVRITPAAQRDELHTCFLGESKAVTMTLQLRIDGFQKRVRLDKRG